MSEDIFEFWSPSRIEKDARWHPDDETVFNRRRLHHFETECLPIGFFGPLTTAVVVLLFLSPGFSDFDVKHARTTEGQEGYARQRTGEARMWSKAEHAAAWKWWTRIVRQFGVEEEEAAGKIAVLNIGAYHSKRFHDHHMLAALPSSRVALDYAQSVLLPDAEDDNGRRVVVCLRSPKYWGLAVREDGTYGRALFAPRCTPGGIMWRGPVREQAIKVVQDAVRRAD